MLKRIKKFFKQLNYKRRSAILSSRCIFTDGTKHWLASGITKVDGADAWLFAIIRKKPDEDYIGKEPVNMLKRAHDVERIIVYQHPSSVRNQIELLQLILDNMLFETDMKLKRGVWKVTPYEDVICHHTIYVDETVIAERVQELSDAERICVCVNALQGIPSTMIQSTDFKEIVSRLKM